MNRSAPVQRGALFLLLGLAVAQSAAFAQQAGFSAVTFDVTTVASEDADPDLQRRAVAALSEALAARGGVRSETPGWLFLVGALGVEDEDADQVVLSVVTLHTLPEQAVEWGREAEIFYAMLPDEEPTARPEEGRSVREHVSEEFIRQFGMAQGHELVMVERADLEAGMREIADRFFRRHTRP